MRAKQISPWRGAAVRLTCASVLERGQNMDQNTAAISALQEYVKIEKPRYAFMIEAPWGAGKTHLVKREFNDYLSSGKARYVTLNGVSDRRAFRRALLADTPEAKLTEAAGVFGDAIGKFSKLGNVGSIVQDAIEDRMINSLPDLLIFDDVERCEMLPGELLGLINDFVEHQTKNVVLCAFIERYYENDDGKKRDDFLSRKEKVVGRTVRIVADACNALPEFISAMPDGHGKQWFQSNGDLVLEVFSEATHSNLRVLRQCLHDCGRVIDVLDEDLRASTDSMIRFVRTYLVLSMSLATGEMKATQLSDRSNYKCVVKPDEGGKPHPLYTCVENHPHAEIFAGNAASIIPVDLGFSLIGIGYEEHNKINAALRATGQFSGEKSVPLWRRFVEWREMPKADLDTTYQEAYSYIFENDEIESGPYLHVAHDLVSIAKDGFGNEGKTAKNIEDRIATLAKKGKIPAAAYGRDYGWSTEVGNFSFGGYAFGVDEISRPYIEAMRNVQFAAYEKTRTNEAERLLRLLREDLEAFGREFSWNDGHTGYHNTAILHEIDAVEFANAIFGYVTSGDFKAIGTQLRALADRQGPGSIPEELVWASKVKSALSNLAEEVGPLEKARMVWFLGLNWKFLEENGDGV